MWASPIPEQDETSHGRRADTQILHGSRNPRAFKCSACLLWDDSAVRPAVHESKTGTGLPGLLHGSMGLGVESTNESISCMPQY